MVIVQNLWWEEFTSIKELTDRYEEARMIFDVSWGDKGSDTLYNREHGYTTPEEMSKLGMGYQSSVAYIIVGRMEKSYEFEEFHSSLGGIAGFRIREIKVGD